MTDQGPSNLPIRSAAADALNTRAREEQSVRIVATEGDLKSVRSETTLRAEVTKVARDGTVTLQTESGQVEIRSRTPILVREGQVVEIEIPPGSPPQQAMLRVAADEKPAPAPAPQTPATSINAPEDTIPVPLPSSRPALPPDVQVLLDRVRAESAVISATMIVQPRPLPVDAIVRFVPLRESLQQGTLLPQAPALETTLTAIPQALPAPLPSPTPTQSAPIIGTTFGQSLYTPPTLYESSIFPAGSVVPDIPDVTLTPVSPSPSLPNTATTAAGMPAQGPRMDAVVSANPFMQPDALPTISVPMTTPETPAALPLKSFDARIISIGPGLSVQIIQTGGDVPVMPGMPAGNPSMTSDNTAPATLNAQIIGHTTTHMPVIALGSGPSSSTPAMKDGNNLFLMQFPASNLPVGSEIQILPQQPAFTPGAAPSVPTPFFDLMSGWAWPAMDDLANITLPPVQAGMVSTMMNTAMVPNATQPEKMPAAILFLMAAARAGDVSSWLGERNANALRREGARGMDLLARLTRDFSGLSQAADQTVSQDWKAMPIPMFYQGEIQKMHLYYRHQGGQDEDDTDPAKGGSTRFIFDFTLSRMGDVQLDGLMKGPRLDLILRTGTAFSPGMQNTMRQTYGNILENASLNGDITFQTRKDQWVKVDVKPAGWLGSA